MKKNRLMLFLIPILILTLTGCHATTPADTLTPAPQLNARLSLPMSIERFSAETPAAPSASQAACPTQILCPQQVIVCPSANKTSAQHAWAKDFKEMEPAVYVNIIPVVEEYLYYRKQAVFSGSSSDLWKRFPDLKQNTDKPKGINAEDAMLYGYRLLKPLDANILAEYYDRLKMKENGKVTQVLLHGLELYTFLDQNQNFSQSGGEFAIILSLTKKDGRWTIIQTDEVTTAEFKE